MDSETKWNLFHARNRERWHNIELNDKPTDTIQTEFGEAVITIIDETNVSIDVTELQTIWGVTYKIKGTMKLNIHRESWWFSNHTLRAKRLETPQFGRTWQSVTPSTPTHKAHDKIRDALAPLAEKWIEKNWQKLGDGKRVSYANQILQARAKIADIQKQLDMRTQWLDAVEEKFNESGVIDEPHEYFNLYGRYWRFD